MIDRIVLQATAATLIFDDKPPVVVTCDRGVETFLRWFLDTTALSLQDHAAAVTDLSEDTCVVQEAA